MNRIVFIIVAIAALLGSCSSADKETRQLRKAIAARQDSLRAVAAMESLKALDFAVAADRISFKHGGSFNVNSTINFIARKGDWGAVQIASSAGNPGPNGIGGITLEGAVRNTRLFTDEKGTTTLTYTLSDKGLSADIMVRLGKGQINAIATVDAAYSGAGMTIYGILSPYSAGRVVKGSSL